jgi:hypothetical protein
MVAQEGVGDTVVASVATVEVATLSECKGFEAEFCIAATIPEIYLQVL